MPSLSKEASQSTAVKKRSVCCGIADVFVVKIGQWSTCTAERRHLLVLALALHDAVCYGLKSRRVGGMRMIQRGFRNNFLVPLRSQLACAL